MVQQFSCAVIRRWSSAGVISTWQLFLAAYSETGKVSRAYNRLKEKEQSGRNNKDGTPRPRKFTFTELRFVKLNEVVRDIKVQTDKSSDRMNFIKLRIAVKDLCELIDTVSKAGGLKKGIIKGRL